MPNPSTRVCAHRRARNFLSASPAWAVDFWSEPRHWPLDICWPCRARDSWLMDVKANLAKVCAGGLSVTLLPSAPFSWQHHPAPASLGMGGKGSAGRCGLWGSLTLIKRILWFLCAHTGENGEVRLQGARARAQPNISVTHCTSPACWTLAKSFQVEFWTFSLLSQLVAVLLPGGVANLRKQRDWREVEKGAWQRRLGRGEV